MGTAERRSAIMKLLCRRRYETIGNLASEFSVSERTIRRDIEVLSYSEPIYTQSGRHGGGVYVVEGFTIDRMYMTKTEIMVLHKVLALTQQQNLLSTEEQATLECIITNYQKPTR